MSESIIEELLAENVELRSKLGSEEIGSIFHVLSIKPMKISGVLIAEGVWKGIKYSYDKVLKPALNKFKGLKGLVMHGKTEEFKDRQIGKLTKVACDDILKAITFEAEVTDPEAIEKIKEGVFDAVSIKGKFDEIDMSSTPPEGVGYTPIEWSLTGTPACKNCLIFSKEELSRSIENFISEDAPGNKKVNNMSEEEFEIKENEVLVEDFTEVEAEVLPFEELAKTKKKRKIIRVKPGKYPVRAKRIVKYFGYPYPYYYYPYYYYPNYEESLDDLLDLLPLAEDYKSFMKKCMNEKKDIKNITERMKACAMEWKKQNKGEDKEEEKEEEIKEKEEMEMAEIKCPVCGEVFKSKNALIKHWNEEHKEKYGEYSKVKKLIKDRELVNKFRKVFALEEDIEGESTPTQDIQSTEQATETQKSEEEKGEKEEEKKETPKETKEEKEEEPKKKSKEEKKEVTTQEPERPKKPEKPTLKELYNKLEKTPEVAAELLIASTKEKYKEVL